MTDEANAAIPHDPLEALADQPVQTLVVQPDGKILVDGHFTTLSGEPRQHIGRLNADGTPDRTFDSGANKSVGVIVIQPNGMILAGGSFEELGGKPCLGLGRLNPDGSLDPLFSASVGDIVRDTVSTVVPQRDGRILVGGFFSSVNGQPRSLIGRLHPDGTLDTAFNPGAGDTDGSFVPPSVQVLAVQPDGKILVAGRFVTLAGQSKPFLGRLHSDGSLDTSFDTNAKYSIQALTLQVDGKILVGGDFSSLGGQARTGLGRLNSDGSLDPSFNPVIGSGVSSFVEGVYGLSLQVDGQVLAAGNFQSLNGEPVGHLARLPNTSQPAQMLSINATGTAVTWTRSGPGPELTEVRFDSSTDGEDYTMLGYPSRITGGWRLSGLSLPPETFHLRARGQAIGGRRGASRSLIGLVEQADLLHPVLAPVPGQPCNAFQFTFRSASIDSFTVLMTTDLKLPTPAWTSIGPATNLGGGLYQFIDTGATNSPQRFYQLRSP